MTHIKKPPSELKLFASSTNYVVLLTLFPNAGVSSLDWWSKEFGTKMLANGTLRAAVLGIFRGANKGLLAYFVSLYQVNITL